MAVSTKLLEDKLKEYFTELMFLRTEAPSLSELFAAEISSDSQFSAAANDDAVTQSTKLSKQEVNRAKTIADRLDAFFTNAAVASTNVINHAQGIVNGSSTLLVIISTALETFGERAVVVAQKLLDLYDKGKDIQDLYADANIEAAVGGITTGEEIPWYVFTKTDLTEAITLVRQLDNLIDNSTVTTGDYGQTVSNWAKIL